MAFLGALVGKGALVDVENVPPCHLDKIPAHCRLLFISKIWILFMLVPRCGCNIITTSEMLESCDPCAEFKRKKAAENACRAREA